MNYSARRWVAAGAVVVAAAALTVYNLPEPTPHHTIHLPIIQRHDLATIYQLPKKGVAVSQVDTANCDDAARLNVGWWYNWLSIPHPGCEYSAGFVPMLWDGGVPLEWADYYAARAGWLLGYNEPDQPGQANMSPTAAAIGWRAIESRFANVRLVSPVPSQANPGWLLAMRDEYRRLYGAEPRFDAIGVHIYFDDAGAARDYIYKRHLEWPGKRLWVTEYNSCLWVKNPDWRQAAALTAWMEQQDYIERYAWFVSGETSHPDTKNACTLLDGASVLTAPGRWFVGW